MEQSLFIFGTSIISILLGALITYFVQSKVLEKTRKFQLKDKSSENRKSILLNRIELIEKFVSEIFFSLKDILSLGVQFNNAEIHPQVISDKVATLQNKMQYLSAMASVLANDELNQRINTFENKLVDFNSSVNKMLNQKNMSEVGISYSQLQLPFIEIIKQLDLIRIDLL